MNHMKNTRAILLCADDYALHPLVNDAVRQLALAGRLSATSCMTTSPLWPQAAPALRELRPRLSVGLHFNLTESHGGLYHALTLKQAIAQAYLGRWRAAQWQAVWREQLDAFEAAMGTAPDFIDGHQHVHQLPGVRQALQLYVRRIVREIGKSGIATVIVDKNHAAVTSITHRSVILVKGQVVFDGDSEVLRNNQALIQQHLGV